MVDLSNIFHQRAFVQYLLHRNKLGEAIAIGLIGTLIFPIESLVSRYVLHRTLPNELQRFLLKDIPLTLLYFAVSIVITFFVCRIFKGRGSFRSFFIGYSWSGLYGTIVGVLLIPLTIVSASMKPGSAPNGSLLIFALICAVGIIIIAFYIIRYEVIVIKEIFTFSTIKSIIIWIATFIPLFFGYSQVTKITEEGKKTPGIESGVTLNASGNDMRY